MGKRHQIYVRVPFKRYQENNPNNRPAEVVGIHHQWLYGRTAIYMLGRFLTFIEQTHQRYCPFVNSVGDASQALAAIYSVSVEDGYYHRTHVLDAECENPYLGDNNDGITVIDLALAAQGQLINGCDVSQEQPLAPRYCFWSLGATEGQKSLSGSRTYSAREYVESYYPNYRDYKGRDMTDWIKPILPQFEKYPVIPKADLAAIFPKMHKRAA